jgi:hypothetical protein
MVRQNPSPIIQAEVKPMEFSRRRGCGNALLIANVLPPPDTIILLRVRFGLEKFCPSLIP